MAAEMTLQDKIIYAYQNGWIDEQEYEDLLTKEASKPVHGSENQSEEVAEVEEVEKELNKLEKLELAKSKGWIDEAEYNQLKPKIESEFQPEESYFSKIPRTLARGAKESLTGLAETADLLASPIRAGLNVLAKPFGKEIPSLGEEVSRGIDSATGGYTTPQNDKEKLEAAANRSLSAMIGGLGSGAALQGVKNAPTAIKGIINYLTKANKLSPANIGATTGAALAGQEYANVNPESGMLGQLIANTIGASVGGGLVGAGTKGAAKLPGLKGLAEPKSNYMKLPQYTAAQEAPLFSKRSSPLIKTSLDLAASDPTYARQLSIIQRKEFKDILDEYKQLPKTSGKRVVREMLDNFNEAKDKMYSEYVEGRNKLFSNLELKGTKGRFDPETGKYIHAQKYPKTDNSQTLELIDNLIESTAKEDPKRKLLHNMRHQLEKQEGNPVLLDDLKKSWGEKAKYHPLSSMYLGERKNSALKQINRSMSNEMKEQIPGYKEMLEKYAPKIEELQNWKDGVIGDYYEKGKKDPSALLERMFTIPDEDTAKLIQKVISPKTYEKAANTYMHDFVMEKANKASRNQKNMANKMFSIQEAFQNNKNLDYTLPAHQNNLRKQTVKRIAKTELGVPRNDYMNQVEREMVKGNEAKGIATKAQSFGKSVLPAAIGGALGALGGIPGIGIGSATGAGLGFLAKPLQNKLNREMLLTGIKPKQQLKRGIIKNFNQAKPLGTKLLLQSLEEEDRQRG